MAIVSTLFGGICGFVAFICAALVFDVGILSALNLYALTGISISACLIASTAIWRQISQPARQYSRTHCA
ncbi:hypothetical protein [uncultured Roseobacter sp.]|uniref:hypothetical protein n=1 Tax=uncultured Roseobacter sp. TaxID=114847 RepID=UPI00260B8A5C|nr:hypothetical protein [uncultured Roseobacter sp.]